MTDLRERTAHKTADPARSENRVPHRPRQLRALCPIVYSLPKARRGTMHRIASKKPVESPMAVIARKASSIA